MSLRQGVVVIQEKLPTLLVYDKRNEKALAAIVSRTSMGKTPDLLLATDAGFGESTARNST